MVPTIQPDYLSATIKAEVERLVGAIGNEAESRAYQASNALTNATAYVLRGQRNGRRYSIPGTGRMTYNKRTHTASITYKKYTASAPGESPAVRTGVFRAGWTRRQYVDNRVGYDRSIHAVTENGQRVGGHLLGEILEQGRSDGRMAARPYKQKVVDMALPPIMRIYQRPYGR